MFLRPDAFLKKPTNPVFMGVHGLQAARDGRCGTHPKSRTKSRTIDKTIAEVCFPFAGAVPLGRPEIHAPCSGSAGLRSDASADPAFRTAIADL